MKIFTFKKVLFYILITYIIPSVAFYAYLEKYKKITAELKYKYPVYVDNNIEGFNVEFSSEKPKDWIEVNQVSKYALNSVIVSEDWAFYSHNGFDLFQLSLVFKEFFEKGKFSRGASTITQQVAKNLYLSSEKKIMRKVKELVIALAIEKNLNKDKILEIYFNIATWGPNIRGIRAAGEYYFLKPPWRIDLRESAFLAMLLPSPVRYSNLIEQKDKEMLDFTQKSIHQILGKLFFAKKITEDEYKMAMGERLKMEQRFPKPVAQGINKEDTVPNPEESISYDVEEDALEDMRGLEDQEELGELEGEESSFLEEQAPE